jgi:tetratricopeptide (TPR) repeat protein
VFLTVCQIWNFLVLSPPHLALSSQSWAQGLREQAITLYRQQATLISSQEEKPLLKRSFRQRRLATCLSYLGYHLGRMRQYKEALEALEQAIALQKQGYADFGALASSYGDQSQILMELGRFREAVSSDEKAMEEIQRCIDAGDGLSQEDLSTYQVNRGRLYLRIGKIEEAEQILQASRSHIHDRRRMYRMFAKEALDEIEQWKRSTPSPQYQLDWRWVERFRELVTYDSYCWLTWAGPFTEAEQQEWDRSFAPTLNEATKEQLGALMKISRERELIAALAEQREPCLHYPALDIEEVRIRITKLQQLDNEIVQNEPNAIVRRLYHDTIEEELNYMFLIEATYEGDSDRFWDYNVRLNAPARAEEMHYALTCVKQDLWQGLQQSRTKPASEHLIQVLREQCGISFDLSTPERETEAVRSDVSPSSSNVPLSVSAQTAKRFFEAALREAGFVGWQVVIDQNASGARVEQGSRCFFLENRSLSVSYIKHLLLHELAGHVARCVAGERSPLGLLGIHSKDSLETEEGLASYYDIQEGNKRGERRLWTGTLATGFAAGVISPPQTFRSLYTIFEALLLLRRLLKQLDPDEETAQQNARQSAIVNCLRTFRGVPDLTRAGICYTQDALYLRGFWKVEQALEKDSQILDRLAIGVVAIDRLPDLQELGIVSVPQPLRKLAEDPQLEQYILSFNQAEK